MAVNSRSSLITYCKQKLGEPVVQVNVDEAQISDRIDEALNMFRQFHYDGITKGYRAHTITQDDIDNEYITIPDSVMAVTGMLKISILSLAVQTQVVLQNMPSISTSFTNYYLDQMNLALFDRLFNSQPGFQFTKVTDKLQIATTWADTFEVGDVVVFQVHIINDPETYGEIYDSLWLKKYATALIKQQWGTNLVKFQGITLPGGVVLDGQRILSEATDEIEKLELEIRDVWSEPVAFAMG